MARLPLFPSLCAEAVLADVQVRQTLALGLVPLGIVLLLMAAGAPEWPRPGLWIGAGTTVGGMACWGCCGVVPGAVECVDISTTHFLVRYLFIVLCPVLLWIVFGDVDPRTGWNHAADSAGAAVADVSGQPDPAGAGRDRTPC